MKISAAAAALSLGLWGALGARNAHAWTTVLGNGMAHDCAQAALAGETSERALSLCSTALEAEALSPGDLARTYVNRAVIYMSREDWEKCRLDLAAAEKAEPAIAELYVDRGALYIHDRRFQDAIDQIDHGLTLNTSEPEKAYYNRAMAREALDDARGAYFDYRKALELNPKWPAASEALTRFKVELRPHGTKAQP
jgi:tetratricopeptide (TPR) repeat protein